MASGDPTLGSWRFATTRESVVMDKWVEAVKKLKIRWVENMILCNYYDFEEQSIPGGWIWDDIGNYYGASAEIFNWRENQYDIILRSGDQVGDPVKIIKIEPEYFAPYQYTNNLKTAAKGTGDNAYIYSNGRGLFQLVGTIPAGEKAFTISGSTTVNGIVAFDSLLRQNKVFVQWPCFPEMPQIKMRSSDQINVIHTHYSPPLDSINYWFLKKSVNLYGEALIKTFAYKKTGFGSTEKGVELLKDFWMQHGIDKGSVNIMDGSGLSPQNRVTADAEVKVLQYAKTRPWFNSFFNALPEFNGMKMKSGAIGGARAYTGYHTASNGAQYIFSIIVNNYTGSSSEAVKKIYKVLDVLK
jgi:D-alanyl-D-alanine carboxypeptidase/D-alanyl-D-alanine-endopeptidase (penicillin-binding protein 4)